MANERHKGGLRGLKGLLIDISVTDAKLKPMI